MEKRLLADPLAWKSLGDQLDVAEKLFADRGLPLVQAWPSEEVDKIDDADFAHQFAGHVGLPGVADMDYAHRFVSSPHGDLVGGIRFYGRDATRPFVEIVAHSFDGLDSLRDCVREEWSMFAPPRLRFRVRPDRIPAAEAILDMGIHVGRYRDMTALGSAAGNTVTLEKFSDVEEAVDMVATRHQRLAISDPDLAQNLSQADPDDLGEWHAAGQLRAICAPEHDSPVGLLAIGPGRIAWIQGDEILEEIVSADHSGHGYAAAAQITRAQAETGNPDTLLIGTIDRLNSASRKTASRVGRRPVLADVFVAL